MCFESFPDDSNVKERPRNSLSNIDRFFSIPSQPSGVYTQIPQVTYEVFMIIRHPNIFYRFPLPSSRGCFFSCSHMTLLDPAITAALPRRGKKLQRNRTEHFFLNNFPEVTHIISISSSWAKVSHMCHA